MRRADLFVVMMLGAGGLALGLGTWGMQRHQQATPVREANRRLVASLQLTDLALFTEARYTRHLSQADGHAAFQDHPLALEHFPSGSLVFPLPSQRIRP